MHSLEWAIHAYLAVFYTGVALFYTVAITRQQQVHNEKCVHTGQRYSLHWFNHFTFRVFRILIWGVCIWIVIEPNSTQFIGIFSSIPIIVRFGGCLLMLVGFIITLVARHHLANSWRSGIDDNQTNALVKNGLYSVTRNPSFIGVMLGQIGFALALPSIFATVCLIVGIGSLWTQMTLEEKHLQQIFGQQYKNYMQQVPRWI